MVSGKNSESGQAAPEGGKGKPGTSRPGRDMAVGKKGATWVESAELSRINHEVNESGKSTSKAIFMVFQVLGEQYALPIEVVKEVVKVPKLAPLPQTPDYIPGAGNIRGNILAIIDLKRKFDPAHHAESDYESGFVVVINNEEYKVGLLVEGIPDTISVNQTQVNTSASVINNLSREDVFIKGIIKLDREMIILIDVLEMLAE